MNNSRKNIFFSIGFLLSLSIGLKAQNVSYNQATAPIGGNNNTAVGWNALPSLGNGHSNAAFGWNALELSYNGSQNTAIGAEALRNNATGQFNTALGFRALYNNNAFFNTGLGWGALASNIGGGWNTATGNSALLYNVEGIRNTANGYAALHHNTASYNTAMGYQSLFFNTTGEYNVANGYYSLYSNTTGTHNTATGGEALHLNTTGIYNTATGFGALRTNTTGNENTANGLGALYYSQTGSQNEASGFHALHNNTTGGNNTASGHRALWENTTGSNNTAIGQNTGLGITTGSNNTILGANVTGLSPTLNNTIILADGVGNQRFYINSLGNAGLGTTTPGAKLEIAGQVKITGGNPGLNKILTSDANGLATWEDNNVWRLSGNAGTIDGTNFIGTTDNVPFNIRVNNQKAGRIEHATSTANTFYGFQTGNSLSQGQYNTAMGYQALSSTTNGSSNTATGHSALGLNTSGGWNTANGFWSLKNNSSGVGNVAIGGQALEYNTLGNFNVAVGGLAIWNNTVGNFNSALGFFANVGAHNLDNATAIGNQAIVNTSNKIRLGDPAVTLVETQTAYGVISDGRFKTDIREDDVKGLEFITKLRPVVYNFDTKKFQEFLTKNMPDSIRRKYMEKDFAPSTAIRQSGFIAQEVEKTAKEVGYNFNGVHKPDSENDNYSLAYSQFVVPLVKAVQEQQVQIEDLKKQVAALTASNTSTNVTTNIHSTEPKITAEDILVYPNPSEGLFNINTHTIDNGVMEVFTLAGVSVKTVSLTKDTYNYTLDLSKEAKGVYIIAIVSNDIRIVKSIIVQ